MKKRILYIHHGQGLGGAPLSLLALIKTLDQSRYHPMVLFLKKSEIIDLYKKLGIEVYGPINTEDFPHTVIWSFAWYHAPYLAKAITHTIKTVLWTADIWLNRLQPDIIHLNTSSLIAWGYAAHKKKIPVIWHVREPLADGYLGIRKKVVTSCVSKYANTIIPISSNDARPWAHNNKTIIISNPVDHTVFNYEAYKHNIPSQPTILFLGGLSREKGTLLILKIFRDLLTHIPNSRLVIAGYFDLKKRFSLPKQFFPEYKYTHQVKKMYEQLEDHITLTGPTTSVPELISRCTVLVFPSTVGHFARPVIEAGFMHKPVIASRLAPLDELVVDGATGYLCNPTETKEWVTQLTQLLLHPALCKEMGERAYNYCRNHFSLETYGNKIEPIYSTALKKERGNALRKT